MKKHLTSRGGWLLLYFIVAYLVLVVAAIMWATPAHAQTACPTGALPTDAVRVCWTNAAEMVDGSPIPATGPLSIVRTEIRRSICTAAGAPGATIETVGVPPTIGHVLFTGLPPARHCIQARHVLENATPSAWSAHASKTTTAPAPPKPRQPNVTVS